MLRYAYLKSDFHPQMLILGEADDLLRLAAELGDFSRAPRWHLLSRQHGDAPETDAELALVPSSEEFGLTRPLSHGATFEWRLDGEWAGHFADIVARLARRTDPAGSELLEIGGDLAEISVKVSRGEFTDDFLVNLS